MTLEAFYQDWFGYSIYFVAYVAALAAFAFTSIFMLRVFTIFSSACFVVYYYLIPTDPLWLDIFSEGVLVLINAAMIIILWFREKALRFTDEEKEIYTLIFSKFSPFEFYKLVKSGEWKTFEVNERLTEQGEEVPALYFIYSGQVTVLINGDEKATVRDGNFIGELSFTLNQKANADTLVATPSRILYWPQNALTKLLEKNPAMKSSLEAMITQDLAQKLSRG